MDTKDTDNAHQSEDSLRTFQRLPDVFKLYQPASHKEQSQLMRIPRSFVNDTRATQNLSLYSESTKGS